MNSFDADGWYSGAHRRHGPKSKTTGVRVHTTGIVLHSAEGSAAGLMAVLDNEHSGASWHFSSLKDGTFLQHYPIAIRCWHARGANSFTVGVEHEGVAGEILTEPQIENAAKLILALRDRYNWPKLTTDDMGRTLWEHRWVEGSSTSCPSGRIPWQTLMLRIEEADKKMASEEYEELKKAQENMRRFFATALTDHEERLDKGQEFHDGIAVYFGAMAEKQGELAEQQRDHEGRIKKLETTE